MLEDKHNYLINLTKNGYDVEYVESVKRIYIINNK